MGAAIITGLNFVFNLFNLKSGEDAQDKADLLQAESDALGFKTAILSTGVEINKTKSNISAYESFLAAFPNSANLAKNSFEAQSRNEYKSLLDNYAMGNAYAGASGRVGGSAGLVTEEARSELADFSGEDLSLGGGDGGRYQMAQTELWGNITAQEQQANSQLGILRSSLSVLNETLGLYTTAYESALARATPKPATPSVVTPDEAGADIAEREREREAEAERERAERESYNDEARAEKKAAKKAAKKPAKKATDKPDYST